MASAICHLTSGKHTCAALALLGSPRHAGTNVRGQYTQHAEDTLRKLRRAGELALKARSARRSSQDWVCRGNAVRLFEP